MRLRFAIGVVAAALALGACHPKDDASFDARVKAYLLSHPDELRAALVNMQAKEDQEASAHAQAALPSLRAALEQDPGDFVANPNGKITVTEFYDYRCPHCINIAPTVVSLIKTHPNVRFVFKEWPIFGDTSAYAARAALAAKAQGKDYVGLYQAFMSDHALSDAEVNRIAASKGIDLAKMNSPAEQQRANAHLAAVARLASDLNLEGTPGFIVGDTIIKGDDAQALTGAIAAAEKKA